MSRSKNDSCPGSDLSRRQMMRLTAAAGLGAYLIPKVGLGEKRIVPFVPDVSGPGHVVRVHQPGMKQGFFPNPKAARAAVDKAVMTLSGEDDPGRAWLHFVKPTDRVGIKINCLGTRMVSSMKEVVFAIADAIRDVGVEDANIVIIDMFSSNMMGGRYDQRHNPRKLRVIGHKEQAKYQRSSVTAGPVRARFADIYQWTTAIINVPVLKDHDLAGVTCCMKNMTFGTVEKPHLNHKIINETCAHLWAHEEIRSRVRLNLIDGTSILYDGGPKYNRRALVTHDSIYATTDPVAMDSLAYEMIELLRVQNNLKTLADVGRPPRFLEIASNMGLGVSERSKIRLETVVLPAIAPVS